MKPRNHAALIRSGTLLSLYANLDRALDTFENRCQYFGLAGRVFPGRGSRHSTTARTMAEPTTGAPLPRGLCGAEHSDRITFDDWAGCCYSFQSSLNDVRIVVRDRARKNATTTSFRRRVCVSRSCTRTTALDTFRDGAYTSIFLFRTSQESRY